MKELKRFVAILSLLDRIEDVVGKTFIQKGIYMLQEGLKEDLNYDYKLHFYGPFSQELANDIDALHDMELITMEYNMEGYGYKIRISKKGKKFLRHMEDRGINISNEKISKILSLLEGEFVKRMELLGTTLYFAKLTNDEDEIRKLVNIVKPHFNDDEIKEAFKKLREEGMIKEHR